MEWSQVIFLFLSNAALTVPLILWMRSESRSDWRHCDAQISAIQTEMKDFHTRLALQDQEFKMRLCAIEERNKGK